MYSAVSATSQSHRPVAAAAAGLLFLAVAMQQHIAAGAAPTAGAAVHHVVGGDPGWDVASDVLAWALGTHFAVGDTLWLKHEAADGGGVAEVGGEAEFEAGNPIRMYTDGLSRVALDGQGARYFVSADPPKCRTGLKLRVDVAASGASPRAEEEDRAATAKAPAPSASSGAPGVAPVAPLLMRRVLLLSVFVWCFLFLGVCRELIIWCGTASLFLGVRR